MDQDNVLMENELERSDRNPLELSTSSTNCRTPTPELDTNFIAWRNPVISIDEDDSVGPPSPNQNDYYESPEQVKDSLNRDLEFIKRYALDAESDVLYSLLSSEVDNPNRLEFVMHDMLGLPNVPQLIAEYKKSNYKTGDKRSSSDTLVNDSNDVKKRKINISGSVLNAGVLNNNEPQASSSGESSFKNDQSSSSEQINTQNGESSNLQMNNDQNGESSTSHQNNGLKEPEVEGDAKNEFLDSLKDMFPDADGLFLISESQHIKNWDECSRFINTVMLSGLYPKKGAKDDSWKTVTFDSDDEISEIPNSKKYRSTLINHSDDETVGSNNADDEALIVLEEKIVKTNDKPISFIDISNDKPGEDKIVVKNEMVIEDTVNNINDETMMTVSSNDSNATETYEADLPILPVSDFDQLMADELDFLLSDLNDPPAAPQPVPSTSAVSTKTNVKKKKRSPSLNNLDLEMEVVSSTSEEPRNAESDELDSILQMPGPSRSFLKVEKEKEKVNVKDSLAEANKIIKKAKKIVETAKIIADKDLSPVKVNLTLEKPKNTVLKQKRKIFEKSLEPPLSMVEVKMDIDIDKDKTKAMNLSVSNAVATPTVSKNITKLPETEISSTNPDGFVNQRVQTPPPCSSRSFPSRPKIEPAKSVLDVNDEELNEVVETTANKLETQISAEEEKAAKENKWIDEQTANLVRIFPNTDPTFLKAECAKMQCSDNALNEFVVAKLEQNDMPTRVEYEKRIEMEELQNRYTKNFVIQDFLKAIPDPWAYFSDSKRNSSKYKQHSMCYLKSTFRKHLMKDITDALIKNNGNLYLAYQHLKNNVTRQRCGKRTDFECSNNRPTTIDIQFLQEVAFIENEKKIKDYLEAQRLEKELKFEEARKTNSLLECQCCYDNEVLVEDTVYCPNDHNFCKSCVIRSVEVEMGNGRHQFNCMAACDSQFTLSCLQTVLKPEVFSKVIQAIQMEEIKAAGIEGLVQCPFCNYATILPPEEKVMTCLNPECLKESCRLCKELNHIPLRCEEVEKSEDIKLRTYIENKMTEALVRTCYKCNKKFVKEDGCNKMTCTCGARMCYVCRQPVNDYSHFNGQGGTDFEKCPLYSTNDELHVDVVKKVAEEAKKEVLKANPEKKLVHDPTMILPERRNDPLMTGMVRPRDVLRQPVILAGAGPPVNLPGRAQINVQNMPYLPVNPIPPVPRHLVGQLPPVPAQQDLREPYGYYRGPNIQVNQYYQPYPAHRNPIPAPAPAPAPPPPAAGPATPPPRQRPAFQPVRVAHGNHRRHRQHHQAVPRHREVHDHHREAPHHNPPN